MLNGYWSEKCTTLSDPYLSKHELTRSTKKKVSLSEDAKIETRDVSAKLAKSCSYCEGFFHLCYKCPAWNATC